MEYVNYDYKKESKKLIAEIKKRGIKISVYNEGSLLELYLIVNNKKINRFLKDYQQLYCWLDGVKTGMEASALMIAPNGATYFD